jgi:hypothetical protein
MMKLTTNVTDLKNGEAIVAWRVGINRKGFVKVYHEYPEDAQTASELIAIRYLLFCKKVFDRQPLGGEGLLLETSSANIKKLASGKSSKSHLHQLSSFLRTILAGVSIKLTDASDPYLPGDTTEFIPEEASEIDSEYFDVIKTPNSGLIRITQHAIDRYVENLHSGDASNPIYSLAKRLRNKNIKKQALPENVVLHKMRKYGTVENLEIWGHDTSQMHFLVVRDKPDGIGTLATVYKRHPAYLSK